MIKIPTLATNFLICLTCFAFCQSANAQFASSGAYEGTGKNGGVANENPRVSLYYQCSTGGPEQETVQGHDSLMYCGINSATGLRSYVLGTDCLEAGQAAVNPVHAKTFSDGRRLYLGQQVLIPTNVQDASFRRCENTIVVTDADGPGMAASVNVITYGECPKSSTNTISVTWVNNGISQPAECASSIVIQ